VEANQEKRPPPGDSLMKINLLKRKTMKLFKYLAHTAAAFAALMILALTVGCSKQSSAEAKSTAEVKSTETSNTAPSSTSPEEKSPSKLGDLSFRRGTQQKPDRLAAQNRSSVRRSCAER
jgi:hypothetical protein